MADIRAGAGRLAMLMSAFYRMRTLTAMWPFDKGIGYARHSPAQVESERAIGLARVRELVAEIDSDELPDAFLRVVASGEVATDFTGQYIDLVKAHLDGRGAR